MKRHLLVVLSMISLVSVPLHADDQSVDAALGGAVGGGLGALIGNELWGRSGAITGGALGAGAGAAVATDDYRRYGYPRPPYDGGYVPYGSGYLPFDRSYGYRPPGRFCPPGQARKGRCW